MYDPTSRVLAVLELLQSRPGITGKELARRLEVDVRTVRRYVTKLQDAGIPVETIAGRRGGYRLRPGYSLPPLVFTPEEAAAIVVGLIAGSQGSLQPDAPVSKATIESALSKLTRVMPKHIREQLGSIPARTHSVDAKSRTPAISLFLDLIDAADSQRRVEFSYTSWSGENTTRVVEPYGLAERAGRWYLVGYCRLRSERRIFRLDRIDRLRVLDETFRPDPEFDYRAYADEVLTRRTARWSLTVQFHAGPGEVGKRIPPNLGALAETENGALLECPADDLDEAARLLALVGLPFTVLHPPELRSAVARLADQLARAARS